MKEMFSVKVKIQDKWSFQKKTGTFHEDKLSCFSLRSVVMHFLNTNKYF